jgi:hypothetical protein
MIAFDLKSQSKKNGGKYIVVGIQQVLAKDEILSETI